VSIERLDAESCIKWFAVDNHVSDQRVVVIRLDVFEP
jgi:hypothetical protein